jgi:hypothetical protein
MVNDWYERLGFNEVIDSLKIWDIGHDVFICGMLVDKLESDFSLSQASI